MEVVLGGDVLVERRAQLGGQLRVGVPGPGAGPRPQRVQQQPAGARAQQVDRGGAAERVVLDAVQFGGLQLDAAPEGDDAQPGGRPGGGGVLRVEGELPGGGPAGARRPARPAGASSAPRAALRSTFSIRCEPLTRATAGES